MIQINLQNLDLSVIWYFMTFYSLNIILIMLYVLFDWLDKQPYCSCITPYRDNNAIFKNLKSHLNLKTLIYFYSIFNWFEKVLIRLNGFLMDLKVIAISLSNFLIIIASSLIILRIISWKIIIINYNFLIIIIIQ